MSHARRTDFNKSFSVWKLMDMAPPVLCFQSIGSTPQARDRATAAPRSEALTLLLLLPSRKMRKISGTASEKTSPPAQAAAALIPRHK